MPADRSAATIREPSSSRQRFFATVGAVASLSTAGCSGGFPRRPASRADDPAEVTVENGTSSRTEIAIRITNRTDGTLFSHVFALAPETIVSRGAIDTTPSSVHAFTADGVSRVWRYDPELPVGFECEPTDIGLTLHQDDTIEPWYDC